MIQVDLSDPVDRVIRQLMADAGFIRETCVPRYFYGITDRYGNPVCHGVGYSQSLGRSGFGDGQTNHSDGDGEGFRSRSWFESLRW